MKHKGTTGKFAQRGHRVGGYALATALMVMSLAIGLVTAGLALSAHVPASGAVTGHRAASQQVSSPRLAKLVTSADGDGGSVADAKQRFTVTWKDDDGAVLSTSEVDEGEVPAYQGATPSKAADAQYTYRFDGWAPAPSAATGDVIYTARYARTVNRYTVTWKNYDGTTLETDASVEYGALPEYNGATPYRQNDAGNNYTFSHWSPDVGPVSGDVVYTAVFTAAPIELRVEDYRSDHAPIAGAQFTLANSAGVVVWTSAASTANGLLSIPRLPAGTDERAGVGGATFAPGSTYTLRQTRTDASHFLPKGEWTLSVGADGSFSCKVGSKPEEDMSTLDPVQSGIRFYIRNQLASFITYDYNYPAGVAGQPAAVRQPLGFLAYRGAYLIELADPQIDGYDFIGWQVDGGATAKHGDTVWLDTLSVQEHAMTARWRNPLNVSAVVYSGGRSDAATAVAGSEGVFDVGDENSKTFASLSAFCSAYGEQNEAVRELNGSPDYDFAFAVITTAAGQSTRIAAVQYDAAAHAWQYQRSAGASWTAVAQGDKLTLYYTRDLVTLQWVKEGDDGKLEALDGGKFPSKAVAVGNSWTSSDEFIADADKPVVYGSGYYRYLGVGPSDAQEASGLTKAGLESFSLKGTPDGFRFRTGASGEGELLSGDIAVYLVYSEDPPEGSSYLDIVNRTGYPYRIDSVFRGAESSGNDVLAQGKVALAGDVLEVLSAGSTVSAGASARLVLLGDGPSAFVCSGGFVEDAPAGTVVGVSVSGPSTVVRTSLSKQGSSNGLASTREVTRGTLEAAPVAVAVTFDSNLTDLTVKKEWSADSYPDRYNVDFELLEDGKQCIVSGQAKDGLYTVSPSDWSVVIANLPAQSAYSVVERAVREVSGSRTVADVTGNFKATYTRSGDVVTVFNERSNPVCRVGSVEFPTISAAVTYIGEHGKSGTIEMIDDYIMSEGAAVTIPAGYKVVLQTAQGQTVKTVTRGFAGATDMFLVKGQLAVADVVLTGKLGDSILAKDGNGGLATVAGSGARLTAKAGAVLTAGRAANGSAVYAQEGATVAIEGARVTANQASSGGAIGVADASCRVLLSGSAYVYGNRDGDNRNERNVCLDQDSNDVIRIVGSGLTGASPTTRVGVYVPDGDAKALWSAHGQPAKPFATYESAAASTLDKLSNDRLSSGSSKYGAASTILGGTVVWGETFSFSVTVQWLDEHFDVTGAPAGAEVELKLNGGSTTPADSVKTTVTRSSGTGWAYTFTGLAKYDGSGNPYEYRIAESKLPADYKQVVFAGDKAVQDNPVRYDAASGDGQVAIVSNYYRYTALTVSKSVAPGDQRLKSTFSVYGVPKTGADLSNGSIRLGGVGGVNDLPLELRSASADGQDGLFHTEGGNRWQATIAGDPVAFHKFYDSAFYQIAASGTSFTVQGVTLQVGDIVRVGESGECYVRANDGMWHGLGSIQASYLEISRQDGNGGVEGAGGEPAGKSCTIENSGTYTFTTAQKLSSDYYYYVVETQVQETNNQKRTISGTHKLVATYDPQYRYDQLKQEVVVTNTRQDYLSVDKVWPDDTANPGKCVFDVYEVESGATKASLKDASKFAQLVKADYSAKTPVLTFTLPEPDTGSWVHVLKDDAVDADHKVYMVRERTAGGVAILNPDVADNGIETDAVLSFDEPVNQITVRNMSSALCKVADSDGTEHPFRRLNDALTYGRNRTNGDSTSEFTIEMLRDYSIPASDVMSISKAEKITLTTASATQGDYVFAGDDEDDAKATIVRMAGNALPFAIVNGEAGQSAATSLTLERIAFDGSEIAVNGKIGNASYANGGFVYARNASVVLRAGSAAGEGVEMRNAKAANGGAIYAEQSGVTVSGALFENCQSTDTNANADRGGGAVWTSGTGEATITGSRFESCTAKRSGGAIASMNENGKQTTVASCTFDGCEAGVNGGAVYTRNLALSAGGSGEGACAFVNCKAGYRGGGAFHDNMKSGSATKVSHCSFAGCTTTAGDDNQNNRHGGGGLNSNADALELASSSFKGCRAYVRGGGVLHFNLSAAASNVTDCVFDACETDRSGGGGMGLTGVKQLISGCTVTDCKALASAGGGLDVACFNIDKDTVVEGSVFKGCVAANAHGGGICFGGRMLALRESTFDSCSSTTQHGGGVAVSAGGSMEELDVQGCTFSSCSAPAGSGGAVYTLGAVLEVTDAPSGGAHTTFTGCTARTSGGAVYHGLNSNNQLEASRCALKHPVFTSCSTGVSSGGALYVSAKSLEMTGQPGIVTFKDCEAQAEGGAVRHDRNSASSQTVAASCSFEGCASRNSAGGALWTSATRLEVSSTGFSGCRARSTGGAVYHAISNNAQIDGSSATLDRATFSSCTSENASGGGMYTNAKILSATGESGVVTFQDCTSNNEGGGLRHDRDAGNGSQTTVADCTFEGCTSAAAEGGGLWTRSAGVNVSSSRFSNCTARTSGGGACHRIWNSAASTTVVGGTAFVKCASQTAAGGGLRTEALEVTVTGKASEVTFSGCTSAYGGGGLSQSRGDAGSKTTLGSCSFASCSTYVANRNDCRGGGAYVSARSLEVSDGSFSSCAAKNDGGALCHMSNASDSVAKLASCSFKGCESASSAGGGLYTLATVLDMTGVSYLDCTAYSTGGAAYQGANSSNGQLSSASLLSCAFERCISENASGGGMYTNAMTLSATGESGAVTFKDCTSKNEGGGLRHDSYLGTDPRSTIGACTFEGCTSTGSDGGGFWTRATSVTVTDAGFSDCTSRASGGGLCHRVYNGAEASASVTKSTFTNCISKLGQGGALRSDATSLSVLGGSGRTRFVNCSAAYDGGAIYQTRNNAGSSVRLSKCVFNTCTAVFASGTCRGAAAYVMARDLAVSSSRFRACTAKNDGGCIYHNPGVNGDVRATISGSTFNGGRSMSGDGGAVYSARSEVVMTGSTVKNCFAAGNGGGLYQGYDGDRPVTLDGCVVTGNEASKCGGGVYFYSHGAITLRNGTSITENTIGNASVENAAGIYLHQNRSKATLVLGAEGVERDTITVYDNKTIADAQSNVRLIRSGTFDSKSRRYENKNDSSTMMNNSVVLLSSLEKDGYGAQGSIGVCNPGPENTRFGMGDVGNRTGVEYIVSDIDTMRGKLDPADLDRKMVLWYAPPVCKITDANGATLRYDGDKTAVFPTLAEAFEVVNVLTSGYLKNGDGITPSQIQVQMLVADYKLGESLPVLRRSITLTTSEVGNDEYHYPRNAVTATSTVTRGEGAIGSMLTVGAGVQLSVASITLDGGYREEQELLASGDGGIVYGRTDSTIVLGNGAVLRNSAVGSSHSGGAVFVTGRSDASKPSFIMERGAVIEGCSAGNGGGVFLTGGVLFEMNDDSHIESCSASQAGGAVYVSPYATMAFGDNPDAVIASNRITDPHGEGAGIYLAANESKLNLQLNARARISENYVSDTEDPERLNGGEAYPLLRQDVYLAESRDPATSITLTGDVSAPAGSIWVWAKDAAHYKSEMQFAVIASDAQGQPAFTPREQSLEVFRNAQDDVATENGTDTYLYGIQGEGANIIWSYQSGEARVILKKAGETAAGYESLAGAEFTVYKGKSSRPYVVRRDDGARETLSGLVSGDNGVFWIGRLPYGTYYLEETTVPSGYDATARWFKLVVDESGIAMTRGFDSRAAAA